MRARKAQTVVVNPVFVAAVAFLVGTLAFALAAIVNAL